MMYVIAYAPLTSIHKTTGVLGQRCRAPAAPWDYWEADLSLGRSAKDTKNL